MIWFNGRLMAPEQALVPALDRGVLWGYGLFETMRAYTGRVWALDDHLDRLDHGAEVLQIPGPDRSTLIAATGDVVEANGLRDAGVRITITRGSGPPNPHAEPDGEPNVIVAAWPVDPMPELYEHGVSLVTLPGGPRPLAGIKSTSYAASVSGRLVARSAGADDALFVDGDQILEATGSNVFVASGGRLTTPPLSGALLPGVTRRYVMQVAGSCGFEVVEAPVTVGDAIGADEVILTSSVREVYPARAIDGHQLRRDGASATLRAAYRELAGA